MYRRQVTGWVRHWDSILLDIVCIELSFVLAYLIRLGWGNPFTGEIYPVYALVIGVSDLLVAALLDTFSGVLHNGYFKTFLDTVKHVLLVLLLNVFFTFTSKTTGAYSRIIIMLTASFHLVLGYVIRILYRRIRARKRENGRMLYVITTKERVQKTVRSISSDAVVQFLVQGIAVVDADLRGETVGGIPVTANSEDVLQTIVREWVDEIYFDVPREMPVGERLYAALMEMGLTIHIDLGNLSVYQGQHEEVERIGDAVVVTTTIHMISTTEALLKRALDLIGGLVGSVLALLVMLAVVIPIEIASPGPLLYRSERIGKNGKRFQMLKIRSMYLDADKRKNELMAQNRIKDGMMFKLDWDPRIIGNREENGRKKTGIGEFIRRTSLDEFPQFFNVLMGSMSLVGTRPPTPDEFEKYEYHHRARLSTKPGITGLWQISGRSEIVDFEEVVKLDMEYITNWSFGRDLRILFQTIGVVLKGKGAM
ncbi:MAG: sugar transferase [Clostridia bacterium]|nr:sugar transferase [Clostridia bacterium]